MQLIESFSHEVDCNQYRVWNDLSGDEGRRRDFGADGKEYFSTGDIYEPDDLVQNALKKLSEELANLPLKNKIALDKTMEIAPEYVRSVNFQMKFLRAEHFDAHLAAIRMALHFEEKYSLFGEERLGRDILLCDLNEDDMECLNSGYLQILNELDFGNRRVLFYYKAVSDCYKDRENLLRVFWYMANTLSSYEDVQKLGVVNVVYNLCGFPKKGMDYEKSRRLARLFKAMPLRMCSFYPCIHTNAWSVVVDTFSVMISKYLRVRLRVIKGDHEEGEFYFYLKISLSHEWNSYNAHSDIYSPFETKINWSSIRGIASKRKKRAADRRSSELDCNPGEDGRGRKSACI